MLWGIKGDKMDRGEGLAIPPFGKTAYIFAVKNILKAVWRTMHEVRTFERHGPRPIPIVHRTGRLWIVPLVGRERSRRSRFRALLVSTLWS